MGWVSGITVFIITWWVVLIGVLPFGVRPPDEPGEGHATSAPENPMMLKKLFWTTVVTAVIWTAIFFAIDAEIYSFRGKLD